jgi:F-type H+-transporting ATPase subunit delta
VRSSSIARRYAEALLENVADVPTLDFVQDELAALAALYRENDTLRQYLRDPSVAGEEREVLLTRVFGDKIHPLLMHFLDLLLHKQRLADLPSIADAFDELVEQQRGQVRVEVITAVALAEDQRDRLKRTLDGVIGKDCLLEHKIDPSIRGGAIAIHGDQVLDGSVRSQLAELRKQLMEAPL